MKIVRKDGIEYERTQRKSLNYDKKLCIKLSTSQYEQSKKKCKEFGISFAQLVRDGIDYMCQLEEYKNEDY